MLYADLNGVQLKELINYSINNDQCNSHDCFILYIDSHGKENRFPTTNNHLTEFIQVIQMFENSKIY